MPARFRNFDAGGHLRAAHPAGQHWLAQALGERHQPFCGQRRMRHALRTKHGEQAVIIGIGGHDLQHLGVAVGQCVAKDVDRIVAAPVRRQQSG